MGEEQRRHEGVTMARFVTIGYGDRGGYDATDAAVLDAAHAHDAQLLSQGAQMGVAGTPVLVRNHDALGVQTRTGPFMRSDLPIGGFALIEAENTTRPWRWLPHRRARSPRASSRSGHSNRPRQRHPDRMSGRATGVPRVWCLG